MAVMRVWPFAMVLSLGVLAWWYNLHGLNSGGLLSEKKRAEE
jgi:hypothetical protein